MSELQMNGVAETLPQATEIILSNKLKCWVYPVSARDRSALIQKWQADNPMPDKKQYEALVPAEDASFEGQTLAAEGNPEYQKLLAERRDNLSEYLTNAFLVGYTEFPEADEKKLIENYARVIARKRRVLDLPADAWEATLRFALLESLEDQRAIIGVIESRLPIEFGDVIDNVRIFRPVSE
jgi:hypothetical protein